MVMNSAIKPSKDLLDIKGSVAYNTSSRAWNIIRLKKEMLEEFPRLRARREKVSYRMVFYRDPVDLFLASERMMDNKEVLPILLYFTQETEQGVVKMRPKKQKLLEAKARATGLRKESGNSKTEAKGLHELGFSNALEFIHYHWSKLSEQDREDLLRAGIPGPQEHSKM